MDLVGKVMSLLFHMLSRLLIAFLPRSKSLLISWLQSPSAVIFRDQENKICYCFHFFPIYSPWSDATGFHDLSFLNVVLSQLFHFPLSPSSRGSLVPLCFLPLEWYHLHMRLLVFLLEILIPAWGSSSLSFHMMYYAYKLNKQGNIIQPWRTSFPIWNSLLFHV